METIVVCQNVISLGWIFFFFKTVNVLLSTSLFSEKWLFRLVLFDNLNLNVKLIKNWRLYWFMEFNESSDCNQPSGYVASMHCNKNKHVTADCGMANPKFCTLWCCREFYDSWICICHYLMSSFIDFKTKKKLRSNVKQDGGISCLPNFYSESLWRTKYY